MPAQPGTPALGRQIMLEPARCAANPNPVRLAATVIEVRPGSRWALCRIRGSMDATLEVKFRNRYRPGR